MQAIEFVAKIKDGVIKVPKKHLKDLQNECRIIILVEAEAPKEARPKKKAFSSLEIKTKGLHFDRDEANER